MKKITMNTNTKQNLSRNIQYFSLPRYDELPSVGLFLEQTVEYINQCLSPLNCLSITSSMVRNYVKQGLVQNPIRKKYNADQIAYLLSITILKQVTSLENIQCLFFSQKETYANPMAYNYFCDELENALYFQFGLKNSLEDIGVTSSIEKEILRSSIIAVSNIIYINSCFQFLNSRQSND